MRFSVDDRGSLAREAKDMPNHPAVRGEVGGWQKLALFGSS